MLKEILKGEISVREYRRLTSLIFRHIIKQQGTNTIKANIMAWGVDVFQMTCNRKNWKVYGEGGCRDMILSCLAYGTSKEEFMENILNYVILWQNTPILFSSQKRPPCFSKERSFFLYFDYFCKYYFTFIPFLVREMRCFLTSTSLMRTSITSPVLKSSEGCLMKRSDISEM